MPTPAEFIVFAVKQALETEQFRFTRNEACRNLKTAIHQYWQNKTLGLHSQSQNRKMYRESFLAWLFIAPYHPRFTSSPLASL